MRLTTKGRYAVTAMLDLSLNDGKGFVALADIADRQGISLAYLEQLFFHMRQHGLVKSVRGPGGGYQLARSVDKISVLDVMAAVGEGLDNTACAGKGNCHHGETCLSHHLWLSLSDNISQYLAGMTLAQVIRDYEKKPHGDALIHFDSALAG